jgi:hypothetical protein
MPDLGTLTFTIPAYYLGDGTYSGSTTISQNYLYDYDSGYYSGTTNGINPTYSHTGYTNTSAHVHTGYTNGQYFSYTGFSYVGIGSSRLSELKKYGSTGYTQNLLFSSSTENESTIYLTGYTFTYIGKPGTTTILQYYDRSDGFTEIRGNTTGFTKEEVFNYALTRNEHFLGFVEQPTVFSDIFVERGKQGVMERNFRLSEVDSMGELSVYGNGYFKVRKQ